MRLAEDDAAAGVDERTLGFPDHLRGTADLAAVALGEYLVPGQVNLGDGLVVTRAMKTSLGTSTSTGPGRPTQPDRTPHG